MGLAAGKISTAQDAKTNRSFFAKKEQAKPLFFQPKLTIGPTDDVYEREADIMADKVMRMRDSEQIQTKISPVNIQRKCAACEEESVQRKEQESDKKEASNSIESYVGSLGTTGQPLPGEVNNFYGPRFGYDFSNVKIHTDTIAAKSAQSINALAYTSGNNIVFAWSDKETKTIKTAGLSL